VDYARNVMHQATFNENLLKADYWSKYKIINLCGKWKIHTVLVIAAASCDHTALYLTYVRNVADSSTGIIT
jgi:hypothetical protein